MPTASRVLEPLARRAVKLASIVEDALRPPLPGPRILAYHQVGSGGGLEMDLEVAAFESQLDWMTGRGRVVGLDHALSEPSVGEYVLTFDDGYADVHANAFPLLRERRLPFTLYLTTEPVETGTPLREVGGARPLTWDQVGDMVETGLVTVGAHTHRHPDLRRVTADEVEEELEVSNRLIEERTGIQPRHFAYPWGLWSATADPIVRRTYRTAALGQMIGWRGDGHLLPRFPVQHSDGAWFFRRRMRGGFRLEERIRNRRHGYAGPVVAR